jgi:hypothetical protein
MGMEKYNGTPNRARVFVCKKYTTFSTERIVALRSVSNFSWRATISQLASSVTAVRGILTSHSHISYEKILAYYPPIYHQVFIMAPSSNASNDFFR